MQKTGTALYSLPPFPLMSGRPQGNAATSPSIMTHPAQPPSGSPANAGITLMQSAVWLVSNLVTNQIDEVLNTELASSRLRAGVALRAFQQAGVELLPLNLKDSKRTPDVAFVSKFVPDSGSGRYYQDGGVRHAAWVEALKRIKSTGGRVAVDYTDHHLVSQDARGAFYREIVGLVDAMVVPSEKMQRNLASVWRGPSTIIPEPIEVPITPPKARLAPENAAPVALWFGHNSNLPYLFDFIARQAAQLPRMDYLILTNGIDQNALKRAAQTGHPLARYQLAKWSVPVMIEAAKLADVALIPSDASDPRKNGVSNGRLLTALALGLPVAAERLESYLPYEAFFTDIRDSAAMTALAHDPVQQHTAVLRAQAEVLPEFERGAIGDLWLKVFRQLG